MNFSAVGHERVVGVPSLLTWPDGILKEHGTGVSRQLDADFTEATSDRGFFRERLPFAPFEFVPFSHPPSCSATARHDSRSSSAWARSTSVLATTIPPMLIAAITWAVVRRDGFLSPKLRSNTLTIARNTVSKARLAATPLRATSVGSATIGHEFSTSSKCCRDRYALTTCAPTSVDERSTCTPSQQFFHSGSVKKQFSTSA